MNFRALKDVELRDVPRLAILIGANGTGKSALFAIFSFLRDAMNSNVRTALTNQQGAPRAGSGPRGALVAGGKNLALVMKYLHRHHPECVDAPPPRMAKVR